MFGGAGYITGRLREAGKMTHRLREVGWMPVIRVDEVSEPLREPGIITGYRKENCSALQAIISLFSATNETVNFWTHFLASLYFMWLLVSLSTIMPLFDDTFLFPLTCYLMTACGYPFMSCLAHCFSCLSLTATHVCFIIDYAAISMYSWGVAYLYYSFCFPEQLMGTWFSQIFLIVAAVNAVFATLCASSSRFLNHKFQKVVRVGAFVGPYVWDSVPLVLWLYTCDSNADSCGESRIYHIYQFACVIIASCFYGSHFPERIAPGCFDIVGHSHNFLHIFSILGTHEQMRAVLIDIKHRRAALEAKQWLPSPAWATTATPALIAANVLLITVISFYLSRKLKSQKSSASTTAHTDYMKQY